MGDAPSDIGPGRTPLVEQLLGYIFKGNDMAAGASPDYLYRQRPHVRIGGKFDDAVFNAFGNQLGKLRSGLGNVGIEQVIDRFREQRLGLGIDQLDLAFFIQTDDTRSNRFQHRLDKGAAAAQLLVRGHQGRGLRFQPLRHPVEGPPQRADLVIFKRRRDARCQIPFGYPLRRVHQIADRLDQPVCDQQRNPQDQTDNEQGDDEQRDIELQLQASRPREKLLIIRQHGLCPLPLAQRQHIGIAGSVEEYARVQIKRGHRLDLVGPCRHDIALPLLELFHYRFGYLGALVIVIGIDRRCCSGDAIRPDFDNRRFVQLARQHLKDITLCKFRTFQIGLLQIVAQVIGHGDRLFTHLPLVLLIIAAGQVIGVFQHAPGAVGEPEFHTILKKQ